MKFVIIIVITGLCAGITGCNKSRQPVGSLASTTPIVLQEIVPEGGLSNLLEFSNPVVLVGPPFEVSVGVRNLNHKLPIQIQYLFEYYDSYNKRTSQADDWRYMSLPAAVELQIQGLSISEAARSWRLRVRPAK